MPEWLKQDIVGITGLSRDSLHVHIGIGLMLAAAALLRGRRLIWAWAFVLTAALANEVVELGADLLHPQNGDWAGSLHDIVNTMIWPSFILVGARIGLLRFAPGTGDAPVAQGPDDGKARPARLRNG